MGSVGWQILTLLLAISAPCFVEVHAQELKLGNVCRLANGNAGTCTEFQNCPFAARAVKNRRRPKVCYFNQQEPAVCCPRANVQQQQQQAQQPWVTPGPSPGWIKPTTTRSPQRITPSASPPQALRPVTRPPQAKRPITRPTPQPRPSTRPPQRVTPSTQPPPPRPPPISFAGPQTPPNSNGKSLQKCKVYAKEVYREVTLPVLLFDPPTELKPDCAVRDHQLSAHGSLTKPKEFPHMAALGYGKRRKVEWLCGGSLISDKFVLTAASCLYSKDRGRVKWARFGDLNMADKSDEAQPQTGVVVKTFPHPRFKRTSFYHDIAVLKLKNAVKFDAFVRPACLNTNTPTPTGDTALATGWGATRRLGERASQDLTKFRLAFRSATQCNETYKSLIANGRELAEGFAEGTMICAGDPENRRDTCVGNSGDPLQVVLTDPYCMYNILGVASFAPAQCGENDVSSVYTRVSHYVPWIEAIVWP